MEEGLDQQPGNTHGESGSTLDVLALHLLRGGILAVLRSLRGHSGVAPAAKVAKGHFCSVGT